MRRTQRQCLGIGTVEGSFQSGRSRRWILGAVCLLGLVGCGRAPQAVTRTAPPEPVLDSNTVATVNGAVISRQMLADRLKRASADARPESVLEELIRAEAVYQRAVAEGFDRQPQVQARIKNLIVAQYRERQGSPATLPAVTDAEIQTAYRAQATRFKTRPAVRGAILFIESPRGADPQRREERRQQAEKILDEARRAPTEAALAAIIARSSEDRASRYRTGDTGWIELDGSGHDPGLAQALMEIDRPGQFAPLIETPRGFYVARLTEKREAAEKPVGDVAEALRYQLARQKAEQAEREFNGEVQRGAEIRINPSVLESLSPRRSSGLPPALPAATTAQVP